MTSETEQLLPHCIETYVMSQDVWGIDGVHEVHLAERIPDDWWQVEAVLTLDEAKEEYREALILAMEEWERQRKIHKEEFDEVRHRFWVEVHFHRR